MKKVISLIFICSVILFSVCGCGNKEQEETKTIYGKYIQTNHKESGMIDGELTLYENGSCAWTYWSKSVLSGEYEVSKVERTYCNYDYIENEIVITYTSYSSDIPIETTCSYENNIIECGYGRGIFERK